MLHLLGRVEPLPPEEVERLLEFRRKKRPLAPEEEELLCAECGFCRTLSGGRDAARAEAPSASAVRPLVEEVVRRVLLELGRG
jgi:hypothetical protein